MNSRCAAKTKLSRVRSGLVFSSEGHARFGAIMGMEKALCFFRRLARPLAVSMAACSMPAVAAEQGATCGVPGVKVIASVKQDAADICQGAKDAIGFFHAEKLKTDTLIEIHVQDTLPSEAGPSAAGCFLQRDGKILMRPYAAFRKNKTWFDVPIDRRLYRSLATHEVAHALGTCNFSIPNPSIQAKEYVAYVTMFSTMDRTLRARILKAAPAAGFENADRLTALLYMFDPMRFGIESYRHHAGSGNGRAYLQEVFSGKVLTD